MVNQEARKKIYMQGKRKEFTPKQRRRYKKKEFREKKMFTTEN